MSNATNPLISDPIALRAMLAEERAENERLRQIIKELQRHRSGRRAESLSVVQLLLGLEEAQIETEGLAGGEAADPVKHTDGSGSGALTEGRCPRTCRVSSRSATSGTKHDGAAGASCM